MEKGILEINKEENPNPPGCIVKALVLKQRLGFRIGEKLEEYLRQNIPQMKMDELKDIYKKRYQASMGPGFFLDDSIHMLQENYSIGCQISQRESLCQLEFVFSK